MKRSFLSLFEANPSNIDDLVCPKQAPRKLIKACLQIDISDSFADKPVSSTKSNTGRKFSFGTPTNSQPCYMIKTSTTPRHSERGQTPVEPNMFLMDNDSIYDDFYQEDEIFNITMKKCHRRRMEDRVTCETRLDILGRPTFFFGIYDGHRNSYVSDYLQRNLHTFVQNHPEVHSYPERALKEAFNKIDVEVLKNQQALNIQGGSTSLCAYINGDTLSLANVGDSKAILIRQGLPVTLNVEHRANNEEERKHVENRGGFVFEKKGSKSSRFLVQGALELTRSIGDPSYKEFITCEPDVFEYKFDENDQYIVMASDGFWNEFNEEQTAALINSYTKPYGLSKYLVGEALQNKQYNIDNISLIVVNVQALLKASNEFIQGN